MQLSVFEMVKHGVSTTIDIVDNFARTKIDELNVSLNAKQNITDNTLTTTAKTIVGAINEHESDILEINSDLTDYSEFTISVGGDTETIIIQKCYKKGNNIHIEFMASRTADSAMDSIWGIIPSQYRPTRNIRTGIMSRSDVNFTVSCGCVINSSNGHIQNVSYNSIPADTTMVFYIEYPIN